jgi:membrane-associated phospholipid phosphatase
MDTNQIEETTTTNQIEDTLDFIGDKAPLVLFLFTLYFLRTKSVYMYVYVIGYCLNEIINLLLKQWFQDPRPNENKGLFQMEKLYKKTVHEKRFGFPSGHTQSVLFSTIYIHCVLKQTWITLLYVFVSLFTIYQRIQQEHHFGYQVAAGGILGAILGFLLYFYASHIIPGKWNIKPDDNAWL